MPVDGKALLDAAIMLAEVEEMRVTVKNTIVSSIITGLAGVSSFLILGPAGLLIGSTVAGLGAYSYNKEKFKPVFAILKYDLRPQQQQELINLLKKAFEDVDYTDAMKILAFLMNKDGMLTKMRNLVTMFMLEHVMKDLSEDNVDVEVKKMTESERHQKFIEGFKKLNGLSGEWCPPPALRANSGSDPAPATTSPTAFAAAPSLFQTSSTDYDHSSPSEGEMHPPAVPKTTLKTTF